MTNRGRNVTTVKHREYLDVVLSPQAAFSYNLQPTNTNFLTWLPKIARNFEMYRVRECEIHYENTASTEQSGAVHMAVDYDVLDDQVPDAHSMSQFTTYVRTGLWKSAKMKLNTTLCNRIPWHYTATHGYPAASDQKLYDFGRLWILTVGSQDPAITAGELYIDYIIDFCSPTVEVQSENTIVMALTPAPSTSYYEQALTPTVTSVTGQQLLEYVATNAVDIPDGGTTVNKYAHIFKALHNFAGEICAEGGVPLSAASRAIFNAGLFGVSDTAAGPFRKFWSEKIPTEYCQWRSPQINYGYSTSDQTASNLAIAPIELLKDKYYVFPWKNASTGSLTAWSTPSGIARNLIYYITERMPFGGYSGIRASKDQTSSSTDIVPEKNESSYTRLVADEDDEEDETALKVRRKR